MSFKKIDATEKNNENIQRFLGMWDWSDNFSTSSYFGDGEGFPTVGYDIESESVEDAEKRMKEIWESENKAETWIREDVRRLGNIMVKKQKLIMTEESM